MAQPEPREQTSLRVEREGSSASSAEQSLAGEQSLDFKGIDHFRETPSSCVGYGGGDDRYHERPDVPNQGYWDERNRGDNEEESRYGQDTRESDSSGTVEQRGGSANYGTVNPNARPSEAGFGSSGPGGYPDEGDYKLGSFGDSSSKQSGTHGAWGIIDEPSGSGSEVRNGLRHGVTSHGVASGAGVSDEVGGSTPTSSDIKQHQYHLTEVAPSQQKDTPYSQMLTELDGPSEGSRDRFQEEEGITGNTKGGTAVDHQKDHSESEGIFERLMHKVSGHDHEQTDSTSDVKGVSSDNLLEGNEDEKPGYLTKVKDKVLPNHDKHHDEMNSELYG